MRQTAVEIAPSGVIRHASKYPGCGFPKGGGIGTEAKVLVQGVTKAGMVIEGWFSLTLNKLETAYPVGRLAK